eukprot:735322-Pelagomonas_calceolata.AAC.2
MQAGPGTIAEALISGLPILLNGNVPCQVSPFTSPASDVAQHTHACVHKNTGGGQHPLRDPEWGGHFRD